MRAMSTTRERCCFPGRFLQTAWLRCWRHTLSIAFRCHPPDCLNWLRHWRHTMSIAFRYHPPDCLNWLRYWRHTMSIAFRRHPPDSASKVKLVTPLKAHYEHRFPVSPSRLPELVTPLKAHYEHRFPVSSSRLPELVTLLKAHYEHRFPVSPSRLCLKSQIGYATEGTLWASLSGIILQTAWIGYATEGTLWASLSGVILQTLPQKSNWLRHWRHTMSIAFRCHPPDSASKVKLVTPLKAHYEHRFPVSSSRLPELVTLLKAHYEHRFPASSSRLCLKSKIGYATEGTLWASLSGVILQTLPQKSNWLRHWRHTMSIAFRCHPPDSASKVKLVTPLKAHYEHRFPVSPSRLCLKSQIGYATEGTLWASLSGIILQTAWIGYATEGTLWASLSGVILQTLPQKSNWLRHWRHTMSIAFRCHPPDSASKVKLVTPQKAHYEHRFPVSPSRLCLKSKVGYATEGTLWASLSGVTLQTLPQKSNWLRHWRHTL